MAPSSGGVKLVGSSKDRNRTKLWSYCLERKWLLSHLQGPQAFLGRSGQKRNSLFGLLDFQGLSDDMEEWLPAEIMSENE
jgi:hypothetical protein